MLAPVGRVVNAGLVAGPGGHQEGFVCGKGNHPAEVEHRRVGYLLGSPRHSTIESAQESAMGTAGPRDLSRYGTHSPQALLRVREFKARTGLSGGSRHQEQRKHETHERHCRRNPRRAPILSEANDEEGQGSALRPGE